MKIFYLVSIEDMIAFTRFHMNNSPFFKRKKIIYSLVVPTVVVSLFLLYSWINQRVDPVLGWVAFFSVVFAFLVRLRYSQGNKKLIQGMFKGGRNPNLIGQHELDISNGHITEKTKDGHRSSALSAVEKIVSTDTHTFIYTSAAEAIVVPQSNITAGDYGPFIRAVREIWENGRAYPQPN